MGASITMSGTQDSAAMDAKLDRILGQLTTITNRLNSHDSRLARVESVKSDAGKGGARGKDDTHGGADFTRDDGDTHRDNRDSYDVHGSDRAPAWADFRTSVIRQ